MKKIKFNNIHDEQYIINKLIIIQNKKKLKFTIIFEKIYIFINKRKNELFFI